MASAWLAAALAFLYPGLGHLYVRAWLRAAAWFGLAVSTVAWLVFAGVIPASLFESAEAGGLEGVLAVSRGLPVEARFAILAVTLFNVVDAFLTARRNSADAPAESGECPECGRELDDDIEFCPWCTARIDHPEESTSR